MFSLNCDWFIVLFILVVIVQSIVSDDTDSALPIKNFSNLLGKPNWFEKFGNSQKNLTEANARERLLLQRIRSFGKTRVQIIEIPL